MVKISVTDLSGVKRDIDAEAGLSLMENIRNNDFDDMSAICGGCCSCCTCHVYLGGDDFARLPEMQDDESYLIEESEHYKANSSRLACQVEVSGDMEGLSVIIAPES